MMRVRHKKAPLITAPCKHTLSYLRRVIERLPFYAITVKEGRKGRVSGGSGEEVKGQRLRGGPVAR
ncbi:hypothetical protein E2C01_082547 [Portunus trituberculatus]|uniref:Uncharacterized protein n=1 Tax=Portunus trituberculatus TaxID=210409 RepID=A0A5B7IYR6_PORTR|nr:hypothetical protein [Portunus trituberculatus]